MNIYIIEDDPVFSLWLSNIVRKAMNVKSLTVYERMDEMLLGDAIDPSKFSHPDVIFIDNHIQYDSAFNRVLELRNLFPLAVIITMSAISREELAVHSLNEGANQYFAKTADFSTELIDYLASDDFENDLMNFNLINNYLKVS